jgi:hypothetical protein
MNVFVGRVAMTISVSPGQSQKRPVGLRRSSGIRSSAVTSSRRRSEQVRAANDMDR